jgi:hypothetical protein
MDVVAHARAVGGIGLREISYDDSAGLGVWCLVCSSPSPLSPSCRMTRNMEGVRRDELMPRCSILVTESIILPNISVRIRCSRKSDLGSMVMLSFPTTLRVRWQDKAVPLMYCRRIRRTGRKSRNLNSVALGGASEASAPAVSAWESAALTTASKAAHA